MGHRIMYIPKPVNPIYYPEYGLLYNWYAATDVKKISSSDDWVVPTLVNYQTLANALGANSNWTGNNVGNKLKESGTTYWNIGNNGTNEALFNIRGSGQRNTSGIFGYQKVITDFWTTTNMVPNVYATAYLDYSGAYFYVTIGHGNKTKSGLPIRLLYTGTGTPTYYTGNNGKVYRVVTIGTQTWLADNLTETRFRNGDIIPWYGANSANFFTNAEWAALTTAGCCAYNNTLNNVAAGFTFPT